MEDTELPAGRLFLDWVYGYRGVDSAKNLFVLDKGELLYYVAAVAVVYNRMDEQQRHYIGHTEDIQCMDLDYGRELVVSGQRAGRSHETRAHIRIWDVNTLDTVTVLGFGECEAGICSVSFSLLNRGLFVCAVDDSPEHILSVWEWRDR